MNDFAKKLMTLAIALGLAGAGVVAALYFEGKRPKPRPAGPNAQLAIFHTPTSAVDVDSFAGRPEFVNVHSDTTKEYVLPNEEQLQRARGFEPAGLDTLRGSKEVTVIDVDLRDAASAGKRLVEAEAWAVKLARVSSGALWDEELQDLYSADAFEQRRLGSWDGELASMPMNVTMFVDDQADGTATYTTGGLAHFALPEISAVGVTRSSRSSFNAMFNAVAQHLYEHPEQARMGKVTLSLAGLKHGEVREWQQSLKLPNGTGTLEFRLDRSAKPGVLRFELDGAGVPSERHQAALTTLYGSVDSVTKTDHDEELLAVSKAAVAVLRKTVKPRFLKKLKFGEVLLVKAPFETTAGGNEWMWVEVQSWKGSSISGVLDNAPEDVPALVSGSPVTVKEDVLFDWVLYEADGGYTGNTTGALAMKRQGKTLPY